MASPECYGNYASGKLLCQSCYTSKKCAQASREKQEDVLQLVVPQILEGRIETSRFSLALTLYSGQTFRWGRDHDGWWKGIAYGVVLRLKQQDDVVHYFASANKVSTYDGEKDIEDFLRWYLRLDEDPKVRVPRGDRYLRRARDRMRGFRFVRQEPLECIVSYILSVQAHMSLTKQRIQFLSQILGQPIRFGEEDYWSFPDVDALALLDEDYYRHQRFGWRSKFLPTSTRFIRDLARKNRKETPDLSLAEWRSLVDKLVDTPNSGIGLKVAKCIDLFSLGRLNAVPVDTWVRKMAADWYGVEGTDARICAWAENRGGRHAGYWGEYLFAHYRELNAPSLDDRVLSFAASDASSSILPFERRGCEG
ncbi:hypothetical protein MK139_08880 [bacterium]|nr:hypothetical protein [bacterium]HCK09842.1 hypothetical protein [Candidatus Latescibacterota bacterium]